MKNIAFILLILAAVCFANCAGDYEAEPRGTNDGKAPAPITNISVKNVNGGAIIKYTPSDDVDLLYVKAIFTNTRGEPILSNQRKEILPAFQTNYIHRQVISQRNWLVIKT